jgi:IMP dehydrogenase
MATILPDVSRTFSEYLLIPRLSERQHVPSGVSLGAAMSRKPDGIRLNIPFVSAAMQSVSGPDMAIALARQGGLAFIFCSQPIEQQAEMVRKVKLHKAGFVESDSNLKPSDSLADAIRLRDLKKHSTMPVTHDGTSKGQLLGILTNNDYWEFEDDLEAPVSHYMTPFENLVYGEVGITLVEANRMLWKHKKECLPIINEHKQLVSLVFKTDYIAHKQNPNEILDAEKRLLVGAGVNTHDYKERVPALVEAGVDVICFDSSDGFSTFQRDAALWVRERYGDSIVIGGGNVVSGEAFDFLVKEAQLDFVKVGIGGGSICITREQKGIGRGQASALMDVVERRDRHYKETGVYIPVCSDGGLAHDTQIIIALAMGADFVMMGRYFARTYESPTPRVSMKGRMYKPYWGEGSARATNWQRYSEDGGSGSKRMKFEEGVDAYVPIVGSVNDVLEVTCAKLRSTLCNCGSLSLQEFHEKAVLTRISEQSFQEGSANNVTLFEHVQDGKES